MRVQGVDDGSARKALAARARLTGNPYTVCATRNFDRGSGLLGRHCQPLYQGAQMSPKFFRGKRRISLAVLAATAGMAASAASAQAVVVTHYPIALLYTDSEVNLSTVSQVPSDFSNGKITPRLTGTLKMESARCYRVHLTSYKGATLLHDKHGTEYCFNTTAHRERSIDL